MRNASSNGAAIADLGMGDMPCRCGKQRMCTCYLWIVFKATRTCQSADVESAIG